MVVSHHILCGYSISVIYKYDDIKNKHDVHRDKDCMRKFIWILKKACNGIINLEKMKIIT